MVFLLPPSGTTCQSAAPTWVAEHAAFGKIGHWRADGVCDRNKNPEFSETDASDEPISHSFLVHWLGAMSVKVSWAEQNWSVLQKDEHADKDEAETWDDNDNDTLRELHPTSVSGLASQA